MARCDDCLPRDARFCSGCRQTTAAPGRRARVYPRTGSARAGPRLPRRPFAERLVDAQCRGDALDCAQPPAHWHAADSRPSAWNSSGSVDRQHHLVAEGPLELLVVSKSDRPRKHARSIVELSRRAEMRDRNRTATVNSGKRRAIRKSMMWAKAGVFGDRNDAAVDKPATVPHWGEGRPGWTATCTTEELARYAGSSLRSPTQRH